MADLDSEMPNPKKPFTFYFKKYGRLFSFGIVALLFTNFLDILAPLILKRAIDQIQDRAEMSALLETSLIFIATLVGVAFFRYLWRIFFGRFHHSVADDLRNLIFRKLTMLGSSFFQKKPTGELMSLITNDVNAFRMGIGPGMLILFDGLFLTMFILPVMFWLNWQWALQTLVLLPFTPFIIQRIETKIHESFTLRQNKLADLSGLTQEVVSGIRVVKSYSQEDNQTRFYDVKSKSLELASNKVAFVDSLFHPVLEFLVACGVAILLFVGSEDVMSGAISIGTLVAFQQYIQRMIWPMAALGAGITFVQQARASYRRIDDLLQTPTDIPNRGSIQLDKVEKIEFRNLTFFYPEESEPALKNISLQIRAGESIGVVGPIGSGKSTLVQALCHLWPLPPETVLINDIPIELYNRESLGRKISIIPQEAFLFTDSVIENVGFGLHGTPPLDILQGNLRHVNMLKEVENLDGGMHSTLGEKGVNLSGGQKQRLTIARALIRESEVTIFDDSLSAVDGKTEHAIVKALKEHGKDRINIIISHRLATLKHADRILVLKDGEVEAFDTHEKLLSYSTSYATMARLQNEGFQFGVKP